MLVKTYRELKIWKEGMILAEEAFRLTGTFSQEGMTELAGQIRMTAMSIPARIAEGWGRERRGEYVKVLRASQGLLMELETYLLLSVRLLATGHEAVDPILVKAESIGKAIRATIKALQQKPS